MRKFALADGNGLMQGCEWVLDTWVLRTAENRNDDRRYDALKLLFEIEDNHSIAVNQKIVEEYQRHLRPRTCVSKWWSKMSKVSEKISFKGGGLPRNKKSYLLNNLGFHQKDIPFVTVAYQTNPKLLVTEDSDYTDSIKDYLNSKLGIVCLPVREALEKAKDP